VSFVPERGNIVHLQFDPGQEMKGAHFGLVVSSKQFNSRGFAMVCPISQGAADTARTYSTVVTLMGSGTDTQGAVHCHQLKSLDWRTRKAEFKESVPDEVITEVMARIEAILVG
jgi:mRNA interferase ChpB